MIAPGIWIVVAKNIAVPLPARWGSAAHPGLMRIYLPETGLGQLMDGIIPADSIYYLNWINIDASVLIS
jgi:hypothetical protein